MQRALFNVLREKQYLTIKLYFCGKCNVHKKKLTRSFRLKKMSVVGKDGNITWVTREVTALVCPVVAPSRISNVDKATEYSSEAGTNKKRRKFTDNCVKEPDSQYPNGED